MKRTFITTLLIILFYGSAISQDKLCKCLSVPNARNAYIFSERKNHTVPAPHSGIFVQNCAKARLVDNIITNNYVATGTNDVTGIEIEASDNARVNCNSITKYNTSMKFSNGCNGSKMRYNLMSNYEKGVELTATAVLPAIMGDQVGTTYEPYDNQWVYQNGTNKIFTSGQNIDWYYQGNSNMINQYYPLPANGGIIAQPTILTGNNNCNDYSRYAERDASFGRAVNDSLHFDENESEQIYQSKFSAYVALKSDSGLVNQGKTDDYIYQDFVAQMDNSNMAAFNTINQSLVDTTPVNNIIALNNSINDTNNVEYYSKQVNEIKLNAIASALPYSNNDTIALQAIATTPVAISGEAAYIAAAMLGLEIHQQKSFFRKANTIITKLPDTQDVNAFPNPSTGLVSLSGIKEECKIKVYDCLDKLVATFVCNAQRNSFDLSNQLNGIYQLRIYTTTAIIHCKLSIIK